MYDESRQAGPDTPYDYYGLSMMTVIVDPSGYMTQSISEVIGRNFFDTFSLNENAANAAGDVRKLFEGDSCVIMFPLSNFAL